MDDLEQIRQLKARYFRFVDTQNWVGLATIFAPDAVIDMTSEGGQVSSTATFVRRVERALTGATTVHHGHMPEIELTSPVEATGIWAMEDEVWWPAGSPIRHLHGYGHYHETYAKRDGRWVITSMRLTRIHRETD